MCLSISECVCWVGLAVSLFKTTHTQSYVCLSGSNTLGHVIYSEPPLAQLDSGPSIIKVSVVHSARQGRPPIEATLTHWSFPTTSRHLGGSHPCITLLLNQRLNVEVVQEVGCCECGISKAHALLSQRNNAAHCVRATSVYFDLKRGSHK